MTYNKNGIPVNRRGEIEEKDEILEYKFNPGTIDEYGLEYRLSSVVGVVKTFANDVLYISGNQISINKKLAYIFNGCKLQKGS